MKLASTLCTALFVLLLFALAVDLSGRGYAGLSPAYWTAGVADAGRAGGIAPVLVSTAGVLLVALFVSIPLSLGGAILCAEILIRRPRLSLAARRSFDVMVSAPSVAVGLVGWSVFSGMLGLSFSLLSGGLTLALMLVPVMTVAFLNGIEGVPAALRNESLSLGVSRWQTLWHLVLPAARPALAAGIVLALGRATAETAALLLTSGISLRMPSGLLDPGATLAVHVYHLARNVPGGESAAYSAALALFAINVLLHFALTYLKKGESR